MVAGCLFLALQLSLAQNAPRKPANTPKHARHPGSKAHALEARGRPDMAIQLWQQILLSDPNNTEALGRHGARSEADRLRQSNRRAGPPAQGQSQRPEHRQDSKPWPARAPKANSFARPATLRGRAKSTMPCASTSSSTAIIPPDGDIALAYYQTLYGTANGKQEAVAGMRALAERNPGDPRFAVELGIMLTYDQKTRAEGIRILREHPKDSNAQAALRQALIWDSANPASAAELREYLKEHPQDTELAGRLKEDESKLAQMNSGIARTPAERAAFAALNAHRLDEAEKRFTAILLTEDPTNGRAAAGMGFLRMQQNNFGGAISFLSQAEANGYKARSVEMRWPLRVSGYT
jgi:tetratricopeptide (TPR) repeat protein